MATIIKADGSSEPFVREKLVRSLVRSGATEDGVQDIADHIEAELSDGLSTETIYRHARTLLKDRGKTAAARYSLRRALFSLGPTGFPFERFLAHLFETRGYRTETGVVLEGHCIPHEVDLVAYGKEDCILAEAKFHARVGTKSDSQVALYSYARFLDLAETKLTSDLPRRNMLITNTKFTAMAIQYAECVGLELLSWNYPEKKTLQDYIEEAKIYPITVLQGLSTKEKRLLLEHNMVLCRDMSGHRDTLRSLGFSEDKVEDVVAESATLCGS